MGRSKAYRAESASNEESASVVCEVSVTLKKDEYQLSVKEDELLSNKVSRMLRNCSRKPKD